MQREGFQSKIMELSVRREDCPCSDITRIGQNTLTYDGNGVAAGSGEFNHRRRHIQQEEAKGRDARTEHVPHAKKHGPEFVMTSNFNANFDIVT